jgi:hypothetical protein
MARLSEPFETAHMLISLLAFPEAGHAEKRVGFETNLNKRAVAALRGQDSDFARNTLGRLDGVQFTSPFRGHARSKGIQNRLGRRMDVARMFRPEVRKALDGHFPDLPPGMKRYSINGLSRYVTSDDEDQSHNFQKRWFQTTLPVLHVAIGFDLASCLRFGAEEDISFNVFDEEFVRSVVFWSLWSKAVVAQNGLYSVPRPEVPMAPFNETMSNSDPNAGLKNVIDGEFLQ